MQDFSNVSELGVDIDVSFFKAGDGLVNSLEFMRLNGISQILLVFFDDFGTFVTKANWSVLSHSRFTFINPVTSGALGAEEISTHFTVVTDVLEIKSRMSTFASFALLGAHGLYDKSSGFLLRS